MAPKPVTTTRSPTKGYLRFGRHDDNTANGAGLRRPDGGGLKNQVGFRPTQLGHQPASIGVSRLALGILWRLAGAFETVLLTFFDPGIASEERPTAKDQSIL